MGDELLAAKVAALPAKSLGGLHPEQLLVALADDRKQMN
jgi:hypothetical protein